MRQKYCNIDYREYVYWLSRVYQSYPKVAASRHSPTLWSGEELSYNEPFVEGYFRHPSHDDFHPAVGYLETSK